MLRKLISYLKENSWKTVYFTQKTDEYGRVKGLLNDAGIKSKTKSSTPMESGELGGVATSYDIMVRQKDLQKANEAIHNSSR
ncbi:putative signal transducing protein [Pseudalkalibacillus sp. SCS-8]|uniref:putative signal transducing protein n=1 Tax=Pseudalkalibacillus nanhaiensis TaxID=3115291 RepID=UPI0032D9D8CE